MLVRLVVVMLMFLCVVYLMCVVLLKWVCRVSLSWLDVFSMRICFGGIGVIFVRCGCVLFLVEILILVRGIG